VLRIRRAASSWRATVVVNVERSSFQLVGRRTQRLTQQLQCLRFGVKEAKATLIRALQQAGGNVMQLCAQRQRFVPHVSSIVGLDGL